VPSTLSRSGRIQLVRIDIARLREDLAEIETFRFDEPYKDFVCGRWQSCMLYNQDGDAASAALGAHDKPAVATEFGARLPFISDFIASTFCTDKLRFARLARIMPRTVLVPHCDYLELKEPLRRIHIPLVSDDQSFLSENHVVYRMRVGEMWFINATQPHSAASFSETSRLHLIVDFVAGQRLGDVCFGPVTEPQGIAEDAIVVRPCLTSVDVDGIMALSAVIDEDNYRDILALLIRKHFRYHSEAAGVFDWLAAIANNSGNRSLVKRVEVDAKYFLKTRAFDGTTSVH